MNELGNLSSIFNLQTNSKKKKTPQIVFLKLFGVVSYFLEYLVLGFFVASTFYLMTTF